MKWKWMALGAAMLVGAGLRAEEKPAMPEMPKPTEPHEWLKRFVGEWATETDVYMEPGAPPMHGTGNESVRSLGGFWIVSEGTSEMMGMTMQSVLTFGYDPEKKVYVGTWIDSMTSQMWKYEGTVDESGNVLTLTTRGFCPMEGKMTDFKSTVEFKGPDERVFTEKRKMEDGSWATAVVSRSVRKNEPPRP